MLVFVVKNALSSCDDGKVFHMAWHTETVAVINMFFSMILLGEYSGFGNLCTPLALNR